MVDDRGTDRIGEQAVELSILAALGIGTGEEGETYSAFDVVRSWR